MSTRRDPPLGKESAVEEAARRLESVAERTRYFAVHSAGRALLQRLELEDLIQEALLRAWQARDAWPPAEPGEAGLLRWMATVVRRTAVDAARAARARRRDGGGAAIGRLDRSAFSRTGAATPADPGPGPRTLVAASEGRERLAAAFRSLSGEHRQVLALRQFAGLSAAETGQRLRRSEAAVHSLFRRALGAWRTAAGADFLEFRDESTAGGRSVGP